MYEYAYNRTNCVLSSISMFGLVSSLGLFLTFVLLLTTNSQFIAFNEYSATGKTPAIYFYVSLILAIVYFGLFFVSTFGIWSSNDIINKWNSQVFTISCLFLVSIGLVGLLEVTAGVTSLAYMKVMPVPLKEHMTDNLRSNYTGGFGMGYLDRQFDRSVDWVQINYQCCGIGSYEDYRNGFYYNSFNKYTIVNIVPSSCCMYREQNQQPSKCQMKSINIYRKGCYDILMWWMESFGILIGCLTICFGLLHLICALVYAKLIGQIRKFKLRIKEKKMIDSRKNIQKLKQFDDAFSETNTINESISYLESRN